jgi:acyl-CoA synthetase (AMP-forming)/AMP-acid ligase II
LNSKTAQNLGLLLRNVPAARTAILDLGGEQVRSITYGELDQLCNAFARGLRREGVTRGDRIAILSLNSWVYIVAAFGAMRLGVVPVLINVKLPKETIAYILRDSAAAFAFAETSFAPMAANLPVVLLDRGFESLLDFGDIEPASVAADELSMLLYTSGTTGQPKGVILHHGGQNWAAEALTKYRRIRSSDRILISAPFYHKNAIVAIKTALLPGACLVILPRFDAAATIAAMERHRLTMLTGVPTMMNLILREPALAKADKSSVRVLSMGSSPASDQLLADLHTQFPAAEIHLNYGSTEGGPIMFGWYHPEGLLRPPHSIGYPIPGCEWKLVNGPSPSEGELYVRNPGVAKGYLNLPQATAARFEDSWYKTGDILRHDKDGWFYFVSRVDDMFVSGGENVFPQEVEALLERHPSVRQAAVIAVPHELKGMVPVAFAVRQAGTSIDEAVLKEFTLAHGPAYAHPRRIVFVEAIPLTGTNKIDRAALSALFKGEASSDQRNQAE